MDVRQIFGSRVFGDEQQQKRLSPEVYESLRRTREQGLDLDPQIARDVAKAMMEWAIEMGATHFTHWFQPMTNMTAGKQDAFCSPAPGMNAVNEFSELELIRGEPDASSFPSGGLRATFEARGYTVWDPTSPAFVKDGALYIPTAFYSYTGEALDSKTPLLRAMQALSREAVRMLRLLGDTKVSAVLPTVGLEQEYFLIDREKYERRLDLKLCGRTLVGSRAPKGQELNDHYCGRIRLRVQSFMKDLDRELWNYGIMSKTRHNETAPAQHEFACVYDTANISCDHNQLAMELARTVAKKHGLACLLHEKPFEGVNGSGKHNNFSLSTDDGRNLLSPGPNPSENRVFLLMLSAFIRSLDKHADLIRLSVATPGNDRRLGAHEAPPSIISVFLGAHLTEMLMHIASNVPGHEEDAAELNTGVAALPNLHRDDCDRNRTSPFAFTGNKFEFRMPGASQSAAMANTVLCTVLADSFRAFSGRLMLAEDRDREVLEIVRETMHDHGRIIYNGNNYSADWLEEAKRRGLESGRGALGELDAWDQEQNLGLFERLEVFSRVECRARKEIMCDNYLNVLSIEAHTLLNMASRQIYPSALRCAGEAAESVRRVEACAMTLKSGKKYAGRLARELDGMDEALDQLRGACAEVDSDTDDDILTRALRAKELLIPAMENLRKRCDRFESMSDKSHYPFPDVTDLIHRV